MSLYCEEARIDLNRLMLTRWPNDKITADIITRFKVEFYKAFSKAVEVQMGVDETWQVYGFGQEIFPYQHAGHSLHPLVQKDL